MNLQDEMSGGLETEQEQNLIVLRTFQGERSTEEGGISIAAKDVRRYIKKRELFSDFMHTGFI